MRYFAQVISWVFLPLLMPTYGLLIAMFVPSVEQSYFQENTLFWMPSGHKLAVISMFFIFSFLAPAISLIMLKKTKNISSLEVDDRSERSVPIFLSAIYALILSVFLLVKAPDNLLPKIIYCLPIGGFVGILITAYITKKDKISLHALGCGFLVAFILTYYHKQVEFYFEIIVAAFLISGLVMSSRLYLNKHTLQQVFSGFLVGFLSMFFAILFVSKIL